MNLERAFPGQESFWEGKDFDILKYALPLHPKAAWKKLTSSYQRLATPPRPKQRLALSDVRLDDHRPFNRHTRQRCYQTRSR
jgi:hypothetical protein